jgi:LysR family transcriptional regulator, hydrogen peroxide-inducible genes activator
MRLTLRQLQYFVAVAEAGAFGPAAKALHVTQPSLSKQIAVLEAELGLALFQRTSRRVELTREGDSLLEAARKTLDAARSFRAEAKLLVTGARLRLQAGVLPSIGAYFMPSLRERLQTRLPDVRISLTEGPSTELTARLNTGELDFVVASASDAPGLECLPLFDETLWFCSHPGDPLMASDAACALSELAGRQFLTLSFDFHLAQVVRKLAAKAGASISPEYTGASLDAIRQMAISGDGIAILPSLYALGEAIRDPSLRVRRIDHPAAIHPVYLYWRASEPNTSFYKRLADEMIAEKTNIRMARIPRFRF